MRRSTRRGQSRTTAPVLTAGRQTLTTSKEGACLLAGDDANRFCNSDEACAGASCAYRTQPQAAPNVDAIRSTSALANFTTSYNYTYANGEVETLFLYGFEPTDRASQYPVYMHGGGAGDRFLMDAADRLTGRIPTVGELPELVFAREMASRGFVAVVMEMPRATNTTLMCDGDWGSMINVTRRVFGYGGAGDTQALCPAFEILPVSQLLQLVWPFDAWNMPLGHEVHSVISFCPVNLPGWQW